MCGVEALVSRRASVGKGFVALAALSGALFVSACGESGPAREPVGIDSARLTAPDTLELTVQSCNGEPVVTERAEDDVAVQLQVSATVTDPGPACQDLLEVQLDAPLADREVLDLQHAVPSSVPVTVDAELPAEP